MNGMVEWLTELVPFIAALIILTAAFLPPLQGVLIWLGINLAGLDAYSSLTAGVACLILLTGIIACRQIGNRKKDAVTIKIISSWPKAMLRFLVAQRDKLLGLADFTANYGNLKAEERIGASLAFLSGDKMFSNAFDYLLYPLVMNCAFMAIGGIAGFIVGGVVMTFFSFLICWGWIYFYDSLDIRLLVLEDVRRWREYEGSSRWKNIVAQCLRKGDLLTFIGICLKFDPFYATIYMRRGGRGGGNKGLSGRRDWLVFLSAVGISNVVWWVPSFAIGLGGMLMVVQKTFNSLIEIAVLSVATFAFFSFLWYLLVMTSKVKKL